MAYFAGRSVTISSPVLARMTEAALTEWIEKWRFGKDGVVRKVPHELLVYMSELHMMGDETIETAQSQVQGSARPRRNIETPKTAPTGSLTTQEVAERLKVSPQMVCKYIAAGLLMADRRSQGAPWMIEREGVDEMERGA